MLKDPTNFLILNGAIVIILVGYFLLIRKGSSHPSRLKMKRGGGSHSDSKDIDLPSEEGEAAPSEDAYIPLNVIFNYNGHSFDAYEALGVPAGSTMGEVKKAYKTSCQSGEASAKPFFDAAYAAILDSQKRT